MPLCSPEGPDCRPFHVVLYCFKTAEKNWVIFIIHHASGYNLDVNIFGQAVNSGLEGLARGSWCDSSFVGRAATFFAAMGINGYP